MYICVYLYIYINPSGGTVQLTSDGKLRVGGVVQVNSNMCVHMCLSVCLCLWVGGLGCGAGGVCVCVCVDVNIDQHT